MTSFRFRLAKVLEWYGKQCHIEEERLHRCIDLAAAAKAEIERHREEVLKHQLELIQSLRPATGELAALGPFSRHAKQHEGRLQRKALAAEQELIRQRGVALAAQMRLRLIEKLRDRRLNEHQYEAAKALEELASETHLAAFARAMHQNPTV